MTVSANCQNEEMHVSSRYFINRIWFTRTLSVPETIPEPGGVPQREICQKLSSSNSEINCMFYYFKVTKYNLAIYVACHAMRHHALFYLLLLLLLLICNNNIYIFWSKHR